MPSPSGWSSVTYVSLSGIQTTNSLLSGVKWTSSYVTYSFPGYGSSWSTSVTTGYGPSYGSKEPWSSFEPLSTPNNGGDQTYFISALQKWADVSNLLFSQVADTATSVGDIRAAYTYLDPDVIAHAYSLAFTSSAGDLWFNINQLSASDVWSPGTEAFLTVLHELGHALGLKHPFSGSSVLSSSLDSMSYTVMSYSAQPGVEFTGFSYFPTTPMLFDIAAIQYLYGANYNYNSGNSTYSYSDSTAYHETIWDGGGTDTIQYSGNLNSSIDLHQGYGSDIGRAIYVQSNYGTNLYGVHNVWIAYGAIIENAIGGYGDDLLTGNDANNDLDGGAGNDTLYGGTGNDIFDWNANQRSGNDVFYGGAGDDKYVLDSSGDSVVEYSGEGTDRIYVSFSFSISNLTNVEQLYAFGANGVSLIGNSLDNYLNGSSGNDTIIGGAGTDTAVFSGNYAAASIKYSAATSTFTITTAAGGTDTLTGIEEFQFSDKTVIADTTAPTVTTFSPADSAPSVSTTTNIVVTFSEAIQRGTNSIILKDAAGTTIETFDAATSNRLLISGSMLTIDPTSTLSESTNYLVTFASGTITDLLGNAYAGTTSYDFTTIDTIAPMITTFSPTNGATGVSTTTNIVATFSEAFQIGTGSIILETSTGKIIETFKIGDSTSIALDIDGVGRVITINPTKDLSYSTGYRLAISSGVVNDYSGNAYIGSTSYNFTTTDTLSTPLSSYTLSTKSPNKLAYSGSSDFTGTGNKSINEITGGVGNDSLNGGLGNDTLTGGDGADHFVFNTKLGKANIDTISDFISGTDAIYLSKKIFSTYKKVGVDLSADFGTFNSKAFVLETPQTAAAHSNTHFLYDIGTGDLYYDADGSGSKAAMQFATLTGHPTLLASDLQIF